MDPITAAVVATAIVPLVQGAAGEAGRQAWDWLVDHVAGLFGRESETSQALAAASQNPADDLQVRHAADELAAAAQAQPEFATVLRAWMDSARQISLTDSRSANVIQGDARVNGPVVQARDVFGSIQFGTQPDK